MSDGTPEAKLILDREVVERLKLVNPPNPEVPRLYYFDARGRAEIIRLIFALRNVQYEDLRCRGHPHALTDFEILKKYKCLPFGQVPLLEINGLTLVQSQAIVRYLGRLYKLSGTSDAEMAYVDMISCATEDIRQRFTCSVFTKDNPDTSVQLTKFKSETWPQWGSYLNTILESSGGTWFVGNNITYADLAVYDLISHIQLRLPAALGKFPLLKSHTERIEAIPAIAAWLSRRPGTTV